MKVEIIGQLSALTGDRPALLMVAGARFNQNCSSKNKRERKLITLNSWYFPTDFRIIPASFAA
jgi:hypothetical protein